RTGKTRVVRRIREMLSLQAEALVLFILHAVAPGEGSIEEVTGVELHAGLGGFDRHAPAALGVGHDGCKAQRSSIAVEHPIVIVTAAQLDLFVVGVDACAHNLGLAEIERCAGYRSEDTGRNQAGVYGTLPVGVDFKLLVKDGSLVVAVEVEV